MTEAQEQRRRDWISAMARHVGHATLGYDRVGETTFLGDPLTVADVEGAIAAAARRVLAMVERDRVEQAAAWDKEESTREGGQ